MSILVLAEHNNKELKSSTLSTITAASQIDENIEVLIKEYALKNNIKECYYYIEWMSQCSYMIDPETLELGDILEFSGQYGDYGVVKNGEMEGVELEELDE